MNEMKKKKIGIWNIKNHSTHCGSIKNSAHGLNISTNNQKQLESFILKI